MRAALILALLCLLGTLSVAWAGQVPLSQGVIAPTKPTGVAKPAPTAKAPAVKAPAAKAKAAAPVKPKAKAAKGKAAAPAPVPVGAKPENESTGFPELDEFLKQSGMRITEDLLPPELRYPLQDLPPLAKCPVPRKLRVRQEPYNSHREVSQPVLRAVIGEPARFAKLETLVEGQSFSCVDSRKQGAILGTPGGDAGEFLVGMSVVEDLLKRELDDNEVHRLLAQWVAWDKKGNYTFFHHTDEDAVRRLGNNLHVNGMAGVISDLNVYDPPAEVREEFLRSLNRTEFQGSHVFKSFLNFPRKFQVRSGLTASFLRAFYATLWDKKTKIPSGGLLSKRLNLEVYTGKPSAVAWLSMRSTGSCEIVGAAHKFSPSNPVPLSVLKANPAAPKASGKGDAKAKADAKPAAAKAPATFLETLQLSQSDLAMEQADASSDVEADMHALFNSFVETDSSTEAWDADFDALQMESQLEVSADPTPAAKPAKGAAAPTAAPAKEAAKAPAKADAKPAGKGKGKGEGKGKGKVKGKADAKGKGKGKGKGKDKPKVKMGVVQVFVHHPHAVTIQRKWLSRFFALRYPQVGSQPNLYQAITRKQRGVMEAVAEVLGSTTPFYTVRVE